MEGIIDKVTMNHIEVRNKFLEFFKGKGHTIYESFSLIPAGDPSLLFTSAGMVPFKDYFTGKKKDLKRAASCQKCLRTGDIESVGKTPFHHTFFEMLGNFSFGDYFKNDAIHWAWDFLTKDLNLDRNRLYISVHQEDKESYEIWSKKIGIADDKIYKLGNDTNFWPANAPSVGPNGPCGPCSEIYYDRGVQYCPKKEKCKLVICEGTENEKCYRCVEVWNLVFTQFNRVDVNKLEPLPNKNIDTGMGFERLLCILEGKETNFDISLFAKPREFLLHKLSRKDLSIADKKVLDHLRAVTFAIADGVIPSNIGRGYIVRKLLRRAMVELYTSSVYNEPFLQNLSQKWVEEYKGIYPEVEQNKDKIYLYIKSEEEKFLSQIHTFIKLINDTLNKTGKEVSGKDAFELYDTYGVPIDLTKEFALRKGKVVNEVEFNEYLEEQKRRSRTHSKIITQVFINEGVVPPNLQSPTTFVGYEKLETDSTVKAIIVDKEPVEYIQSQNKEFIVVIDPTPFYAEEGGQIGDRGIISSDTAQVEVIDTQKDNELIYSICILKEGKLSLYDKVKAYVWREKRLNTARNHTGTHILHAALRKFLGNNVQQAGSLVAPTKLRFDFTYPKKLGIEEVKTIEGFSNKKVLENHLVVVEEKDLEQARKEGALAFFGEKYKSRVRVVSIGDFSKELCGGTHLNETGLVGFIKIISEESIAQGIRRIEAVTGEEAIKMATNDSTLIKKISTLLEVPKDDIYERLHKLMQYNLQLQKELTKYKVKEVLNSWRSVVSKRENIKNISGFTFANLECEELSKDLLNVAIALLEEHKIDILLIHSKEQPVKVALLLHRNVTNKNIYAGSVLKEFLNKFNSSGGGSDVIAQGVVKNIKGSDLQKEFINYLNKKLQL